MGNILSNNVLLHDLQPGGMPCAIIPEPLCDSPGLDQSPPRLLFYPACPENCFPSSHDEPDRAFDTEAVHLRGGIPGQFYQAIQGVHVLSS